MTQRDQLTPPPSFYLEQRALQVLVAIAACVPVGGGLLGVIEGSSMFGGAVAGAALDSHVRYLSGLLLAIGLLFWSAVPRILVRTGLVRTLVFIVVAGGMARGLTALAAGVPDLATGFALTMELVVAPLVCLWQARLARRWGGESDRSR